MKTSVSRRNNSSCMREAQRTTSHPSYASFTVDHPCTRTTTLPPHCTESWRVLTVTRAQFSAARSVAWLVHLPSVFPFIFYLFVCFLLSLLFVFVFFLVSARFPIRITSIRLCSHGSSGSPSSNHNFPSVPHRQGEVVLPPTGLWIHHCFFIYQQWTGLLRPHGATTTSPKQKQKLFAV